MAVSSTRILVVSAPWFVLLGGCLADNPDQDPFEGDTDCADTDMAGLDAQIEPIQDWSDPIDDALESLPAPGYLVDETTIEPAAEGATAVHAMHLPPKVCLNDTDCTGSTCNCPPLGCSSVNLGRCDDGRVMITEGRSDQRSWTIGTEDSFDWTPIPYWTVSDVPHPATGMPTVGYPDIFCAGHAVLADGTYLMAGGNINGNTDGGGLTELFGFDPDARNLGTTPYGWAGPSEIMAAAAIDVDGDGETDPGFPRLAFDRWYPTVLPLPDGRALIVSGGSQNHHGSTATNTTERIEVYDPENASIVQTVDFPYKPPQYPFLFVLPTGDIFYAGGDNVQSAADNAYLHGRILLSNEDGTFEWHPKFFNTSVYGGSAVMYSPGKIVKAGGRPKGQVRGTAETARIDLSCSAFPGNKEACYEVAEWEEVGSMGEGRTFHTMTLLPDGRVMSTGGTGKDNGHGFHDPDFPCDTATTVCTEGGGADCPSSCVADECESDDDCPLDTTCTDGICEQGYCSGYPSNQRNCLTSDDCRFQSISDQRSTSVPLTEQSGWAYSQGGTCVCPDGGCVDVGDPGLPAPGEDPGDHVFGRCLCDSDAGCGARDVCMHIDGTSDPDDGCGDQCFCDPYNSACFATKHVQIWDPECGLWSDYEDGPELDRARMYHSSALLLPSGNVLVAGNGRRGGLETESNGEQVSVTYGQGVGTPPVILEVDSPAGDDPGGLPIFDYREDVPVAQLRVAAGDAISRVTMVRIGTVTHAQNYDQLFVELQRSGSAFDNPDDEYVLELRWPDIDERGGWSLENIAPPGYYLLFAFHHNMYTVDPVGVPSEAIYVRVGQPDPARIVSCTTTTGFSANVEQCISGPVGGSCPTGAAVSNSLEAPLLKSGQRGWVVQLPPGLADEAGLTDEGDKLALERCSRACSEHWAGLGAADANCEDPGSMSLSLEPLGQQHSSARMSLLANSEQALGGAVPAGELECSAEGDCCEWFDEVTCGAFGRAVQPRAVRPPSEFEIDFADTSEVRVGVGDRCGTGVLEGKARYSYATEEASGTLEPFALNEFSAESRPPIWGVVECSDGTEQEIDVRYLTVELAQPAMGARDAATGAVYFEANTLLFSIDAELNQVPFRTERFATKALVGSATAGNVSLPEVTLEFHVPCSPTVMGTFDVRLGLTSELKVAESPPTIDIRLPEATVPCSTPTLLDADVRDTDGDLADTLWIVDGVQIDPSTSSIVIENGSYVEVRATDERGAATTEGELFQCGM